MPFFVVGKYFSQRTEVSLPTSFHQGYHQYVLCLYYARCLLSKRVQHRVRAQQPRMRTDFVVTQPDRLVASPLLCVCVCRLYSTLLRPFLSEQPCLKI